MSAGRTVVTESVAWNTPPKYVDAVLEVLGRIDLDPCSNDGSMVPAGVRHALPVDGLAEAWDYSTIFVNPPYGRDVNRKTSVLSWVQKAEEAHRAHGAEILMLIPVATNTRHFKDFIFPKFTSICFLADTRLRFFIDGVENRKGAPMACCMVYIGDRPDAFAETFQRFGTVLNLRLTPTE